MKLKLLVVASMSLGLISCPVLAATKQKHYKKVHHTVSHNYKGEGAMPMQPAPVVSTVPAVDPYALTMDAMTQNLGREVHAGPDWFQRIAVIGGANVDAAWGNRSMGYMGENPRRISLNDAYLNATALVNDWAKAFLSISFNNAYPANELNSPVNARYPGIYSAAYSNSKLNLEQGYATFGNFNCSPFFFQVGKQFQDFGRYQIHPITRTLAQVMSESLQTSAKVGFLTQMGFHGSIWAFDNSLVRTGMGHTQTVYGASLGFDQPSDQLGYGLGVGYMSNIAGVNDVAYAITAYELFSNSTNPAGTYNATVGAINAYGDINSGPFSLGARYTTAIQNFNVNTLSNQYMNATGTGARPWAADITAAYGFNAWCHTQNIYLGYQVSNNAVNLFIPKNRWVLGYGVDVWKNANFGLEFLHNTSYSSGNGVPISQGVFGGSSSNNNEVHARAGVKFG